MRLTIEIDFPKDRKEYTDVDGRVWKLDDANHWTQWARWALWGANDAALIRCGAKLDVRPDPKPEPFRVRCPKCGEYGEVRLQGAADICIPIMRYREDGYIVPFWEEAYTEDPREGEYEYVCSECGSKIFDNIEQIGPYAEIQGEEVN